jgi:hypothetical protein
VLLKVVNILQFKTQTVRSVQLTVRVLLKVVNVLQFKTQTVTSVQLKIRVILKAVNIPQFKAHTKLQSAIFILNVWTVTVQCYGGCFCV